jgi:hypothetical protein|tara:strand:+ start:220 stop:600 length:381 start_codon:yes stop_codon:yes gene_type:complete
MAHFAKLGVGSIVERVEVVHNDIATTEQAGADFLNSIYKTDDTWVQTSYNTFAGEHKSGGTPFRKNYASVGGRYDQSKDAFIPIKPFESWILNENTCQWEAPVPYPTDGKDYNWNETNQTWDLRED